jgi:hypothetical protein
MTDAQFQKALNKVSKTHLDYLCALSIAEGEYERRFGTHPSDWDDDFWIDTYHVANGSATVAAITASAEHSKKLSDYHRKDPYKI